MKCLYLGKNKITKIQNLDALRTLQVLSVQVGGSTVVSVASDEPVLEENLGVPAFIGHWNCKVLQDV